MLTEFDLFGHPVVHPAVIQSKPVRPRLVSEASKRDKLRRHLEKSNNLMLFEDLLEILKAPLFEGIRAPAEYTSDIAGVSCAEEVSSDEETGEVDAAESVAIPYEAWGETWITDSNGQEWSREGLIFTQNRLFWRSMEELALRNNEQEKWSVLRWIFRPAIWKYYVYNTRIGASHCVPVHERDEPFSFHNCAIAARVDAEAVREGVRRNVAADVVKMVEKVCSFD